MKINTCLGRQTLVWDDRLTVGAQIQADEDKHTIRSTDTYLWQTDDMVALSAAQAMAKLKDMEAVMNDYFLAHAGAEASTGLEVLPGVLALLQALKVRHCCRGLQSNTI
jgi:beta-phosphoglucomutase-like phosphatase (HAD superfamily)